jgi:hypothetical protein
LPLKTPFSGDALRRARESFLIGFFSKKPICVFSPPLGVKLIYKNISDSFLVRACSFASEVAETSKRKCPVAGAFDTDGNTHIIYCGQWSCPRCAVRLANKWAARARAGFSPDSEEGVDELWFLTLTLGSGVRSTLGGFALLPRLWDTTRKQYQRYYGSFSYIAFVEGQPNRSFMPHFHILATSLPPTRRNAKGNVTKRALHDWAHSVGWGFQAELLIVSSAEASAYVAKYASKQSPLTPKGFRRVRVSKDWPQTPEKSAAKWIVPARDEGVAHYIMRISEVTGLDPDDLWPKWADLTDSLQNGQLD